jgi:Cys-tRNA synthase (O-phospho-L-seryl-tRNA:Cys-tRNA synthase)
MDEQLVSGSAKAKAPTRVKRTSQEMTNLRTLLGELDTLEQLTSHPKNCELTFTKATTPTPDSDASSDPQ